MSCLPEVRDLQAIIARQKHIERLDVSVPAYSRITMRPKHAPSCSAARVSGHAWHGRKAPVDDWRFVHVVEVLDAARLRRRAAAVRRRAGTTRRVPPVKTVPVRVGGDRHTPITKVHQAQVKGNPSRALLSQLLTVEGRHMPCPVWQRFVLWKWAETHSCSWHHTVTCVFGVVSH